MYYTSFCCCEKKDKKGSQIGVKSSLHCDSLQPVNLGQVVSSVFFVTNQSRTTRRHCLVCSTPTQDTVVGSVLFAANQPGQFVGSVQSATTPSRTTRRQCSLCSQSNQDNSSACSVCNHSIQDKWSAVFSLQPITPGQFVGVFCLQPLHPGQVVGSVLSSANQPRTIRRRFPVCSTPTQGQSSADLRELTGHHGIHRNNSSNSE